MVSMEKPSKWLICQCSGLGAGQPSNLALNLKKIVHRQFACKVSLRLFHRQNVPSCQCMSDPQTRTEVFNFSSLLTVFLLLFLGSCCCWLLKFGGFLEDLEQTTSFPTGVNAEHCGRPSALFIL